MTKTKILFCGDSITYQTGLAYVISNFMLAFDSKFYEFGYSVFTGKDFTNQDEMKLLGDEFYKKFKNIKVFNSQNISGNKENTFEHAIETFRPNIVISLLDPWNCEQIAYSKHKSSFFWVSYTPLETPEYPDLVMFPSKFNNSIRKSLKKILNKADLCIPVTTMGFDILKKYECTSVSENIFHGLDFSKKSNSPLSKKAVLGEKVSENDFVFFTMGKNNERKKIDKVLEAFLEFLKQVDYDTKYKLYVHTHIDELCGGTDLVNFLNEHKLKEYLLFPSSFLKGQFLSLEELYKRYEVSDCYISLPGGEGFGYGFAEAMMHKKPCVYLDYGGHATYLKNIGYPVRVSDTFSARNIQMIWALPDISDAVTQMLSVVNNYEEAKERGELGYDFAKNNFDWKILRTKFRKVVEANFKNFEADKLSKLNFKRIV